MEKPFKVAFDFVPWFETTRRGRQAQTGLTGRRSRRGCIERQRQFCRQRVSANLCRNDRPPRKDAGDFGDGRWEKLEPRGGEPSRGMSGIITEKGNKKRPGRGGNQRDDTVTGSVLLLSALRSTRFPLPLSTAPYSSFSSSPLTIPSLRYFRILSPYSLLI